LQLDYHLSGITRQSVHKPAQRYGFPAPRAMSVIRVLFAGLRTAARPVHPAHGPAAHRRIFARQAGSF